LSSAKARLRAVPTNFATAKSRWHAVFADPYLVAALANDKNAISKNHDDQADAL
jgi:hypothetical protein